LRDVICFVSVVAHKHHSAQLLASHLVTEQHITDRIGFRLTAHNSVHLVHVIDSTAQYITPPTLRFSPSHPFAPPVSLLVCAFRHQSPELLEGGFHQFCLKVCVYLRSEPLASRYCVLIGFGFHLSFPSHFALPLSPSCIFFPKMGY